MIGKVGESAKLDASGAFLHFAVYRDGTALNPLEVIPRRKSGQAKKPEKCLYRRKKKAPGRLFLFFLA